MIQRAVGPRPWELASGSRARGPSVLWLNVSAPLGPLFRSTQAHLQHCSPGRRVAVWDYLQDPDEPASLEAAIALLSSYVLTLGRPVDLVGHGTAGHLAWRFARAYPHCVRSLALLAVGGTPAVDWQAQYYAQLRSLPWGRRSVLTQLARTLTGCQDRDRLRGWTELLERDLWASPSPSSPFPSPGDSGGGGVTMPLLVCGAAQDPIADPSQMARWQPHLKPGDRLRQHPTGPHFFPFFDPQWTAREVAYFQRAVGADRAIARTPIDA